MSTQIDFMETDAGTIYDLVITSLENRVGEPLYPGDERRIFGEGFVAVTVALFNTVNDSCRQTLLRYARGTVLDAMGERVRAFRKGSSPASTTLRFRVKQAREENIIISAGTRVTPDATLYFATTRIAILSAGSLHVDVPAEATVGGNAHNGYRVGSITTLVDLIPYISSVENISDTAGGDDGEPYTEAGDDSFRERIRLAPAGFSTAGPEGAYRYHALSAASNIGDISVVSDQEAGTVNLVVLMNNGVGPDDQTASRILEAVNDRQVRPMNDLVSVEAPDFVDYDINIHYYVTAETEVDAIETIEGTDGALERYIQWQGASMGRDINPDQLRALVLCPHWESEQSLVGALRIDVTAPSFLELGERQVARHSGVLQVSCSVARE